MNTSPTKIFEDSANSYYKGLAKSLGGQFFEGEHLTWFTTGRRSLVRFNGVLRTLASAENLAAVVHPALDYFRSNNLPFFWADFPPGSTAGLGQFLTSNGIPLIASNMPAMQRSLKEIPAFQLTNEVEITEVRTSEDQADWLEVLMEGFPEPEAARTDFQQYLNHSLSKSQSGWRHFLARWQGEPCAISTLLGAQQAAGIYHVATLPAYRSRGLAKALTLAAVQTAREAGYTTAVLFATPDGYPLYRKLGFETVITADLYAWKGRPE